MVRVHRNWRAALWLAGLAVSVTTTASNAPYPASSVITASWDLSSLGTLRKAPGSDIWPVTWGADGNLYSAWGDGGGFAGTNNVGRVSLGFARISGTPADAIASSFLGTNVWGAAPQYAENPATFGGKVDELISVGGVLYGVGGLWTADNCGCDPTQQSGAGPLRKLAWSSSLGKSWQIAPWSSSIDPGTFLQFGRDYQGAWDAAHVYLYYQGDVNADPTHIYLRRIAVSNMTEDPATPGHFEYFAGTNSTALCSGPLRRVMRRPFSRTAMWPPEPIRSVARSMTEYLRRRIPGDPGPRSTTRTTGTD